MRNRFRFVILIAAVLMQACLGATYSWSIFVHALREQLGLGQTMAQLPFTIFYTAFPLTMLVAGMLMRRLGPRFCAVAGGVVFGGGWIVAGLGQHHFAFTIVGIGLLGGIGVGLAYIVPIAVGMLWFPRNKGLVTGISVAGFAGGAALVSTVASECMSERGISPFALFQVLGMLFACAVGAGGAFMRYPAGYVAPGPSRTRGAFLRDPGFRLLYAAMFVGVACGFAVNANLRQLSPGATAATGALAVAVFAVANAGGRVAWGLLFDRVLRSGALRVNLLCQAGVLLAAPLLIRSPAGLVLVAAVAGFNYGGVLVLYASETAHRWGAARVSDIYSRLFSANIPASVVPLLAGAVFDWRGTFTPVLLALGVAAGLVGLVTPATSQAVEIEVPVCEREEDLVLVEQ